MIKKLNDLMIHANESAKCATGNYYLLLTEDFDKLEEWKMLWDYDEAGYYGIVGNNVFIVKSSLNTLIDITEQIESLEKL